MIGDLTADWSGGVPAGWTSAHATTTAGRLELNALPSGSSASYAAHATSPTADLTGSALTVQLAGVLPDTGAGGELYVQLIDPAAVHAGTPVPSHQFDVDELAADGVFWLWKEDYRLTGGLVPGWRVNGRTRWLADLTFDPVRHSWLRIRAEAQQIVWETAPDGRTWTTRAVWAPTFDVTAVAIDLRAGYWGTPFPLPADGSVATFGTVNLAPEAEPDPVTFISGDGLPYLAVDVIPELTVGTFLVSDDPDDPDGSLIDGDDLLGWAVLEEGAWLNVVCDVTSVELRRGVTVLQGALTRAESGYCTVQLTDTERRFDPMVNADAIHPGTPMRVRAWGYDSSGQHWSVPLFTGTLDDLPVRYLKDGPPQVTLQASDLIADMSEWSSAGYPAPGVRYGDSLLTRAWFLLLEMGLQPDEQLSWDLDVAYATLHPRTPMAHPWTELAAAQDAELGRVWVDRDNRLVVRSRHSELSGPVRGTLSDLHGDADPGTPHVCYSELDAALGTEQTTNRAIGQRRVPDPETDLQPADVQMAQNVPSGARWGWRVTEDRSLELLDDTMVAQWTRDLVAAHSTPQLRVDRVAPLPSPGDLDAALDGWPAVCGTDLGDRWAVRYRPAVGAIVDRTVGVLGIAHTVTPEGWQTEFLTVDAPHVTEGNPSGFFLLDVSELDSGDVLTPRAGIVPSGRPPV